MIAFLSTSWRQLVAWMLNVAVCLVCLVKLFVYGEPIVPESEMQEYYIYKKKADLLMAEVCKQLRYTLVSVYNLIETKNYEEISRNHIHCFKP